MDSLEKERERKDIQCDIFSSFVSIFIMHIVFQRILWYYTFWIWCILSWETSFALGVGLIAKKADPPCKNVNCLYRYLCEKYKEPFTQDDLHSLAELIELYKSKKWLSEKSRGIDSKYWLSRKYRVFWCLHGNTIKQMYKLKTFS